MGPGPIGSPGAPPWTAQHPEAAYDKAGPAGGPPADAFRPNTGELSKETHGIRGGTSGLRTDAVLGAFDWELRHLALDDPGIGPQPPGGKDVLRVDHLIEHLLVQGA